MAVFITWFTGSIPYSEIALMQHELQPDSLVDLKFIMADTGFGKTFIYDRIKSGDLPKAKLSTGEQDGYIVTIVNSKISS